MRIDQKEDKISDICKVYGLTFEYAWGKYYISVPVSYGILSFNPSTMIVFSREDLDGWGVDRVEEMVLAYVIESGMW